MQILGFFMICECGRDKESPQISAVHPSQSLSVLQPCLWLSVSLGSCPKARTRSGTAGMDCQRQSSDLPALELIQCSPWINSRAKDRYGEQ